MQLKNDLQVIQKPNNITYYLKHELNQNEKLTELQNKYNINVIPYFYVFK
jgi:hypothetical protein